MDAETGEEYWVSGVKQRGVNAYLCDYLESVEVGEDTREEHGCIRNR